MAERGYTLRAIYYTQQLALRRSDGLRLYSLCSANDKGGQDLQHIDPHIDKWSWIADRLRVCERIKV